MPSPKSQFYIVMRISESKEGKIAAQLHVGTDDANELSHLGTLTGTADHIGSLMAALLRAEQSEPEAITFCVQSPETHGLVVAEEYLTHHMPWKYYVPDDELLN